MGNVIVTLVICALGVALGALMLLFGPSKARAYHEDLGHPASRGARSAREVRIVAVGIIIISVVFSVLRIVG